jgi:uncharacterized protein (TIGR00251 family)
MLIRVKATPNASKNEVIGWEEIPLAGKVLRVRITAPPVDGKANKAIALFIAKTLNLPKSSVVLTKGQKSRIKTFLIPDATTLPR